MERHPRQAPRPELRARHNLHEGDEVDVIEEGGALRIVRVSDAEIRGRRVVLRMCGRDGAREVEGMSTDDLMGLLGDE